MATIGDAWSPLEGGEYLVTGAQDGAVYIPPFGWLGADLASAGWTLLATGTFR